MFTKIKKFQKELMDILKKTKKSSILVYFILRLLVILCLVLQILRGDMNNAMLCLLSLILFLLPFAIPRHLKIDLPNTLEILILLFIFAAEILGEINNFYGIIPQWDTMLHTINGFLAAAIGFALFDLLNQNSKNVNLSPLYLSIVAFCFSMTIGVLWEFFEYGVDKHFTGIDMQKDRYVEKIQSVKLNDKKENVAVILDDIKKTEVTYIVDGDEKVFVINEGYLDIGLIDTMKDLIVNFIGAFCFSIFGYLYVKNRDKYHFIKGFIPKKV